LILKVELKSQFNVVNELYNPRNRRFKLYWKSRWIASTHFVARVIRAALSSLC